MLPNYVKLDDLIDCQISRQLWISWPRDTITVGVGPIPGNGINTLTPIQNGRHFADDSFNRILLNKNVSIEFSLKFVPKSPINNSPALVQIMAWCRPGDKPLSEPVMG